MTIWKQCLEVLQAELSGEVFETLIRPIQPVENGTRLELLVPNSYAKAEIERNNYLACLHARIEERGYRVDVKVGSLSERQTKNSSPAPQINGSGQLKKSPIRLDDEYTFATFVRGKSNEVARAASLQVAEMPATSYNPLLICGGVGLGKTHLMQAIGHAILENDTHAKICYLNAERFVGDMVRALQHNKIERFKHQYRSHALLIDDIQFLAGKERSQEEFFHTFNSLLEGKRQIVVTCDRHPLEVPGLEERIVSRLGWGLSVVIDPPDLETRVAILLAKAKLKGMCLPDKVGFFIAKHFHSNIRDLEGALNRLKAYTEFRGIGIDMDAARDALADLLKVKDRQMSIENIQKSTAEYFKIRKADLLSKSKRRSVTRPRQIAMALSKELTDHSLPEIGETFGGRDHTTVLHACRRIQKLREQDPRVDDDYMTLLKIFSR